MSTPLQPWEKMLCPETCPDENTSQVRRAAQLRTEKTSQGAFIPAQALAAGSVFDNILHISKCNCLAEEVQDYF